MAGGATGGRNEISSQISDALKNYPMNSGGAGTLGLPQGAPNPQATPGATPGAAFGVPQQPMAPWMQQLGGMGQQMMAGGMQHPMPAPMAHQGGAGPGLMSMPQPLTPMHVNHMLMQQNGLMGGGPRGMQF